MKKFLCISILCSVIVLGTPAFASASDTRQTPLQTVTRILDDVLGPNVLSALLRHLDQATRAARPTEDVSRYKRRHIKPESVHHGCAVTGARTSAGSLGAAALLVGVCAAWRRREG